MGDRLQHSCHVEKASGLGITLLLDALGHERRESHRYEQGSTDAVHVLRSEK